MYLTEGWIDIPWHFACPDRTPPGKSRYEHIMDMQAWQYKNGLRVWCLNCMDHTKTTVGQCRCKLVDCRGVLTYPRDRIMFPHRMGTDACYMCLTRPVTSNIPKACDLQIVDIIPINRFKRKADLSLRIECTRPGCYQYWYHEEGLERGGAQARLREWVNRLYPRTRGPRKWVKVEPIVKLCSRFTPSVLRRLDLLRQVRRGLHSHIYETQPSLDRYLANIYGIATLLHARQTCRAWQNGIPIGKIVEQIQ